MNKSTIDRFMDKVSKKENGCWEWTSNRAHNGYGLFKVANKQLRAHRVAYEKFVGPIPQGLLVCHHCDNPSCVNPEHLFVGTHRENMDDALTKGRIKSLSQVGESNRNAKLNCEDVLEIHARFAEGRTRAELAAQYGVHVSTIKAIITKRSWAAIHA